MPNLKPILKPILSTSDVPTIDHRLELGPNVTPLIKSEEKSPDFAVDLPEKDQDLKYVKRRDLDLEPLVRVAVPDSSKPKSSTMHESFSSIFYEKMDQIWRKSKEN